MFVSRSGFVCLLSELNIDIPHTLLLEAKAAGFSVVHAPLREEYRSLALFDPKICRRFPQHGWCLKLSCHA